MTATMTITRADGTVRDMDKPFLFEQKEKKICLDCIDFVLGFVPVEAEQQREVLIAVGKKIADSIGEPNRYDNPPVPPAPTPEPPTLVVPHIPPAELEAIYACNDCGQIIYGEDHV